jgi:hypothetical protein
MVYYVVRVSYQASENLVPKVVIRPAALPLRSLEITETTIVKEVVEGEETKLVDTQVLSLTDGNTEAMRLFESFLAYQELGDLAKTFADAWKLSADQFAGKLTDAEGAKSDLQITDLKKSMDELIDIYNGYLTTADVGT